MSYLLYPRLHPTKAKELSEEIRRFSLDRFEPDEKIQLEDWVHDITFAPTGGQRIQNSQLNELRSGIYELLKEEGYPGKSSGVQRRTFDRKLARYLHKNMRISAGEAARPEIWYFLTCVVAPFAARWRYPGSGGTHIKRFLGGTRGLRNVMGRLWWRGEIFYRTEQEDPYYLLEQLGEDECVQMMERPNLAGNQDLISCFAHIFVHRFLQEKKPPYNRTQLMRTAIPNLRRMSSVVIFELLEQEQILEIVEDLVQEVEHWLARPKNAE